MPYVIAIMCLPVFVSVVNSTLRPSRLHHLNIRTTSNTKYIWFIRQLATQQELSKWPKPSFVIFSPNILNLRI